MVDITPNLNIPTSEFEVVIPQTVQDTPGQIIGGWGASSGQLSSGNVILDATHEQLRIGAATSPTVGLGVFLGKSGSYYQFRVGDPAGNNILWDGVTLTVSAAALTGSVPVAALNIADRGWSQTCAFSVTDADTVAWGAGTFTSADGTAYSISGGNTGNMAAKTYVYLDIAVSTTAYQTTTTGTTAVGVGKVMIAVAQNGTGEATYQVLSGQGGLNIDAANIVAGSITATELADLAVSTAKVAASAITTAKIAADAVTAAEIATGAVGSTELAVGAVIAGKITAGTIVSADIAANTITAGNIAALTITASEIAAGAITTNKIAALAVTAAEIAANTITAAKIVAGTITTTEIAANTIVAGDIAANTITANELSTSITYAGTIVIDTAGNIRSGQTTFNTGTGWFIGNVGGTPKLSIGNPAAKYLAWDGSDLVINGYIASSALGGDGSDGALSISSGTTTLDLGGARVFVKNYSSISITGTGKLAFSNAHASGTIIFIRSQGNVTLTSSTAPMIDASGMGAAGGGAASGTGTGNGANGTDALGALIKSNKGTGSTTSAVGTGGATTAVFSMDIFNSYLVQKYNQIFIGAGGGGGSISNINGNGNNYTAGSGGAGGASLIIECGGAWNFTTASGISVAGINGGNAGTDQPKCGGGGGGGAGGQLQVNYYSLTANTGTVVTSGGTGGLAEWNTSGVSYGGGGGGNPINAGADGTSTTIDGVKTGGDGGAGYSTIQQFRF